MVSGGHSVRVGSAGSLSGLAVGEFAADVEVADVAGELSCGQDRYLGPGEGSISSVARSAAAMASGLPVRAKTSMAVSANLITCASPCSTARAKISRVNAAPLAACQPPAGLARLLNGGFAATAAALAGRGELLLRGDRL